MISNGKIKLKQTFNLLGTFTVILTTHVDRANGLKWLKKEFKIIKKHDFDFFSKKSKNIRYFKIGPRFIF